MDLNLKSGMSIGTAAPPPSKSWLLRALLLSALAKRETRLSGVFPLCDDAETMIGAIGALGASVTKDGDALTVSPMAGAMMVPTVPCRDSAAVLRFLLPVTAALGCTANFTGSEALARRPLLPLCRVLSDHGVSFSGTGLPLTVSGRLTGGVFALPGDVSSQFVSGLLFGLTLLEEPCEIRLTTPLASPGYVDMTLSLLSRFGVCWRKTAAGWETDGNAGLTSPLALTAEGDWSGAANLLAAGTLGRQITLNGVDPDSDQPDRAIFRLLAKMGATMIVTGDKITVKHGALRPITDDVDAHPDLFPLLCVLAAAANGDSVFTGIRRLRDKESDRVETTLRMLSALGCRAETDGTRVTVHGTGTLTGGTVCSGNDHRIAMAAAVARTVCTGDVTLLGADAVNKSYPGFFPVFRLLGGSYDEI